MALSLVLPVKFIDMVIPGECRCLLGKLRSRDVHQDHVCPHRPAVGGGGTHAGTKEGPVRNSVRERASVVYF